MKTAVVLFNLGGPDSLPAVRPFLFNLFNDRAIIRLMQPLRGLIATLISTTRAPVARKIYALMGGASPLLPNTMAQAACLEAQLGPDFKTFVTMRYWHPRAAAQIAAVAAWQPDRILLLPLYPQYSTTTTGSSIEEWHRLARRQGLVCPTNAVCCWPVLPGFVESVAEQVSRSLARIPHSSRIRILFSAHGLPEKIAQDGDPYQHQIERCVAAVVERLPAEIDYRICYQSRVGPVAWIGPSTESEIAKAGAEGLALIVVPIAFVSEHSETLVELDHDYRILADKAGVPVYERVATAGTEARFIDGLAQLVQNHVWDGPVCRSAEPGWSCPKEFARCGATKD